MAGKDQLLELVPHYVAIVVIVLLVMSLIRSIIELDNIFVEFAIILVLVFAYRPLVLRLDFVPTPTLWEQSEKQ